MTGLRRLLRGMGSILLPKEKQWLLGLALLDLLMSLADLFFLAGLLFLINTYSNNSRFEWMILQEHLRDNDPLLVTGTFVLLFCAKNLLGAWLTGRQSRFVYGVASRISKEKLQLFLQGSYIDFVYTDSSVLQLRINQTPIEFARYVLTGVQQVIAQTVLVTLTLCAAMFYKPNLFLLLIIFLLPPFWGLAWVIKTKLNALRGNIKTQSEQAIQYLQEALAGFVESNVFRRQHFFIDRYMVRQKALNASLGAQQAFQGLSGRMIELFAVLGFFILFIINRFVAGQNTLSIATIGVFVASAYKIIPGLVKVINNTGQIRTYSFTLDELQPQVSTKTYHMPEVGALINSIEFKNVHFAYADTAVLNHVSFGLQLGDVAAITGVSGSGKTTLFNILLGFLQQQSGQVCINLKTCTADGRRFYWPRISYVKQQDFFINDTLLNNITLGDAEPDDYRLQRAVSIAGLTGICQPAAEGLEKVLTENGKNISGGQRQRVTLARALYRDFDVLLLDEPFSELDDAAIDQIISSLTKAFPNKIVVFITHHASSIQWSNKIIRL